MPQTEPDPFMSKFIKPAGTWECSVCMIQNNPEVTKCEVCETPKPTPITKPPSKSLTTTMTTSSKPDELMAKFMKPTGAWECSTCLVENDAETRKCCACETPRPGQTAATLSDAATTVSQKADPLMAKFMKPTGHWECDVCMVQNLPSSYKCEACQTPNPNAAPPPPPPSSGSSGSADVLPKFGSGVVTNSNFKFGSSSDRSASVTSTEGFKFGSSSTSEATGTFKFGTASTTSAETSKSFVFGQSAAPAAVDEKKKSSENSGFKFQSSSVPLATNSTAPFTFGSETNTQPSVERQRDDENTDPLMAKFMKPAGYWECDVCIVQNLPSSYKCEACQTPNPNAVLLPPPSSESSGSANVLSKFENVTNSGFKFGSSSDNSDSVRSTEVSKFGRSATSEATETFKFGTSSPSENHNQKTMFAASSLKRKRDDDESADPPIAKFMKQAGHWECDVCMIQNPSSSYKCEACQTPNPNAALLPPPPPSSGSSGQ